MQKNKWSVFSDFVVRNGKFFFPAILTVVVLITVVVALNAGKTKAEAESGSDEGSIQAGSLQESEMESESGETLLTAEEVPLTSNEDEEIYALIESYYNARAAGDMNAMLAVCDKISEDDQLYYTELSKYIDGYTNLEIYTKQGLTADSTIAYVYYKMKVADYGDAPGYTAHYICRDAEGNLYIKSEDNYTDEECEYIKTANAQKDVSQFIEVVNLEFDELKVSNTDLYGYLELLSEQMHYFMKTVREAHEIQTAVMSNDVETMPEEEQPEEPAVIGPQFANTTAKVNVRKSDSIKAESLGKVAKGTRVEVQEVRVNGWTKIVYEGKDGYIKSEYLQMEESASGVEIIGTVTATTNVKIRSAASLDAEYLGVLVKGESLELIADEDGWCKVVYDGKVAYVKADYVTQQN